MAAALGSVRCLLREGDAEAAELGLASPGLDDAALIDAMAAHPRLIQRPVLIRTSATGIEAEIGRPPERLVIFLGR